MSHKRKASPAKAIHREMISGHRSYVEMALNCVLNSRFFADEHQTGNIFVFSKQDSWSVYADIFSIEDDGRKPICHWDCLSEEIRVTQEALQRYPHQIARTVKALRKWGYKLGRMVIEETQQQFFSDDDLVEISDKIELELLCRSKFSGLEMEV